MLACPTAREKSGLSGRSNFCLYAACTLAILWSHRHACFHQLLPTFANFHQMNKHYRTFLDTADTMSLSPQELRRQAKRKHHVFCYFLLPNTAICLSLPKELSFWQSDRYMHSDSP
jgi:hypothetical protein